jgi:hypothetical protein
VGEQLQACCLLGLRAADLRRHIMGLMDKVKAQATVLAQKTQETARESKARYDQVQAKRHADAMLRNLGAAVYAQRTGRSTPETEEQIDKLVADLSAHESEHDSNLTAQETPPADPGESGSAPDDPTGETGTTQV